MKNQCIGVFQKRRKSIFESWITYQLAHESLREDLMTNDDLRLQSEELLNAIISNLTDKTLEDPTSGLEQVEEILGSISVSRAKQGYSPGETGHFIFSLKTALIVALQEELKDQQQLYEQSMKVNSLIDTFSISTFETFIKGREDVILRQSDEMLEISTPVIRVWDGILALPIIGTLDSARTQVVMESLLGEIVSSGSSIAILDISGVVAVDSLVAQHLIKTVSATRLMGAECIISGIRPEIAQTIVHLGIDLSTVITKATLAGALKTAFSILRFSVNKKQKTLN